MAKSKPTGDQAPKVEVRLHWQPRGTAMESQLLDQPLYAHLPWRGGENPERSATSGSVAGRCGANTDRSMAVTNLGSLRPPIVVVGQAEPGKQLQVRFQFLSHSLQFGSGCWKGKVAPAQAVASSWLPMTEAKTPATPVETAKGSPSPNSSSAAPANSAKPYYSAPFDALELLEWLESTEPTSSLGLATSRLAVHAPDQPALLRPGLAHLALLTGDARDAEGTPPGILPIYAPIKQPWSMRLPSPASRAPRPLRIAWVHTEEYWRDPAQDGKLKPVFRAADTAMVFAANLGSNLQFIEHGGAMLGRCAKIDPANGDEATAGWLASTVNTEAMSGPAATAALTQAPVRSVPSNLVARPWPAGSPPARHRAAVAQPSAKQVLLSGGLMAVRAEVAAVAPVAGADQGPPQVNSLGTFDFLVRYPADILYVLAHQEEECLAAGRVNALGFGKLLTIPVWLNAMEADQNSTRAPWAQPLPTAPADGMNAARAAMPTIPPVLALMSCDAANSEELRQALEEATAPPDLRSGKKSALSAVFAAHGTRPVWEFCLPSGRGAGAGTSAMIGVQAALAGRAIGVVLAEVLGRRDSCASQRGRRARWTTLESIRRAVRTYAYWTGVLSSGESNVGFVYSIWGNLDPKRSVPGLVAGIPEELAVQKIAYLWYPVLEALTPDSDQHLRFFLLSYQRALAQLVARRARYFSSKLASTAAFALTET